MGIANSKRSLSSFLFLVIAVICCSASASSDHQLARRDVPECPPEGEVYFPDPTSCRHYYVCDNGRLSRHRCAGELYWNQLLLHCDYPENVDCAIDGSTTTTSNSPIPTTTTLPELTSTITVPESNPSTSTTENANPICDPETPIHFVPFPGNCSKYYLCLDGTPIEKECAPGLIFNPEAQACVVENSYQCPWNPTSGTTTTELTSTAVTDVPVSSSTTTTTSTSTTTTTPRTTTTTDPTNPFPCPNDAFIYLPHPEDCAMFYLCMNGQFRGVYHCGDELWFHSVLQGCVCPEDSDCSIQASSYRVSTRTNDICSYSIHKLNYKIHHHSMF